MNDGTINYKVLSDNLVEAVSENWGCNKVNSKGSLRELGLTKRHIKHETKVLLVYIC